MFDVLALAEKVDHGLVDVRGTYYACGEHGGEDVSMRSRS